MRLSFSQTLIIVLALLILSLWTCNGCLKAENAKLKEQVLGVEPVQGSAIHFDTVTIAVHDTVRKTKLQPGRIDSFVSFDRDTIERVEYRDTTHTQFGAVIIHDTVEANRVTGRSVITDFQFPVITQTIKTPAQPKAAVFLGLNFQGNATDYVQAFGPSLMLKTKQDRVIELGALYNKSGQVIYQAGLKWKIKLK